jgi:hypothetical protein
MELVETVVSIADGVLIVWATAAVLDAFSIVDVEASSAGVVVPFTKDKGEDVAFSWAAASRI